jgi:hypothetical protein
VVYLLDGSAIFASHGVLILATFRATVSASSTIVSTDKSDPSIVEKK